MIEGLEYLGFGVIILGIAYSFYHPYQRGGIGHRGSRAGGPVWFLIILLGIVLVAVGIYLKPPA